MNISPLSSPAMCPCNNPHPEKDQNRSLNARLDDAIAHYTRHVTTKDFLEGEWNAVSRAAEAESAVDAITAQIRALPAGDKIALAVKIRALAWDMGCTHRFSDPEAERDFEVNAMAHLVSEADAILSAPAL